LDPEAEKQRELDEIKVKLQKMHEDADEVEYWST
jgi:hypothetical protein